VVERDILRPHIIGDVGADLFSQFLSRNSIDQRQVEIVDDPRMDLELLVEQRRVAGRRLGTVAVGPCLHRQHRVGPRGRCIAFSLRRTEKRHAPPARNGPGLSSP
jgi:hypothetical protein